MMSQSQTEFKELKNDSNPLLHQWIDKFKNEFVAVKIDDDNLEKVLKDGVLTPLEYQLRKDLKVSHKKEKFDISGIVADFKKRNIQLSKPLELTNDIPMDDVFQLGILTNNQAGEYFAHEKRKAEYEVILYDEKQYHISKPTIQGIPFFKKLPKDPKVKELYDEYNQCDLITMDTIPDEKIFSSDSIHSYQAYIRCDDELYYMSKLTHEIKKLPIPEERLNFFDAQLLPVNEARTMSSTELDIANQITNHWPTHVTEQYIQFAADILSDHSVSKDLSVVWNAVSPLLAEPQLAGNFLYNLEQYRNELFSQNTSNLTTQCSLSYYDLKQDYTDAVLVLKGNANPLSKIGSSRYCAYKKEIMSPIENNGNFYLFDLYQEDTIIIGPRYKLEPYVKKEVNDIRNQIRETLPDEILTAVLRPVIANYAQKRIFYTDEMNEEQLKFFNISIDTKQKNSRLDKFNRLITKFESNQLKSKAFKFWRECTNTEKSIDEKNHITQGKKL